MVQIKALTYKEKLTFWQKLGKCEDSFAKLSKWSLFVKKIPIATFFLAILVLILSIIGAAIREDIAISEVLRVGLTPIILIGILVIFSLSWRWILNRVKILRSILVLFPVDITYLNHTLMEREIRAIPKVVLLCFIIFALLILGGAFGFEEILEDIALIRPIIYITMISWLFFITFPLLKNLKENKIKLNQFKRILAVYSFEFLYTLIIIIICLTPFLISLKYASAKLGLETSLENIYPLSLISQMSYQIYQILHTIASMLVETFILLSIVGIVIPMKFYLGIKKLLIHTIVLLLIGVFSSFKLPAVLVTIILFMYVICWNLIVIGKTLPFNLKMRAFILGSIGVTFSLIIGFFLYLNGFEALSFLLILLGVIIGLLLDNFFGTYLEKIPVSL